MNEIGWLIEKATAARSAKDEKQRAFGQIVRKFQDLAFGCAYAILGDHQRAEDAAQEAFIVAWRNLDQLKTPAAFPGWFKRIVLTQCNRQTRGKSLDTVSLETVYDLASVSREDPAQVAQQSDTRSRVLAAIQSLPPNERLATTLFYINEYDQNEIAAFLEVPVSTVKKRLYCARQKLRVIMLDLVRDTLQARRPSNDDAFVNTVALFNAALDAFVDKIKQDRYILAAILFGSLSYDEVWRKSDIDIVLIGKEEKKPDKHFCLVENGVNIHAHLMSRSNFKELLEGKLQGSFTHSWFSKSTLLFSHDPTIQDYYENVGRIGSRDRDMQLLNQAQMAVYTLAKAEKWFVVKKDLSYSFLWIMYTVNNLANIEVILKGEVITREVIHQALKINPAFFNAVYFELIHKKKDEATIEQALERINQYLDDRLLPLFRPILEYLNEAGGVRPSSEMDEYFKKKAQTSSLSAVYEWLADRGVIQKVPSPLRLHEKSQIVVEEAAYYYDGGNLK